MSVTPPVHTAEQRAETQREGEGGGDECTTDDVHVRGRVLVADGVVYVRELEEPDDEVVRIVAESDDPVAAVGQCLRVGARALRAAHVTVDVDVIERSFSELETRFEAQVSDAVDEIARTVDAACSTRRTARSPARSSRFHAELDAAARRHVRRRLEVERARQHRGAGARHDEGPHHARDRRQPDRSAEDRAGRHRAARGRRRSPRRCAGSPSTSASSTPPTRCTSRPPARASTTRTWSTSASATLAAGYGDLAEVTAKQSGSCASHVGDEVVTLNRDDTHGVEARFTLEMKNRPLNMRKTMAELDEALVQPRRARRDRGVPLAGAGAHRGAVPALRRQGDRGARPRRRGRLRAAPRLHVGALDGAQGARGERGGRGRPRAGPLPARRRGAARWSGTPRSSASTPRPRRASTRPPTRCATWSTRCTRPSTPSTPSSAPDTTFPISTPPTSPLTSRAVPCCTSMRRGRWHLMNAAASSSPTPHFHVDSWVRSATTQGSR